MERISNADMSKYTSFRAGGCADELIIVDTPEELLDVLKELSEKKDEYIMLGNGSNTLFKDSGYHGTVVKLGESFDEVRVHENKVLAGGGALLSVVARAALNAGLTGFEFASGIPGSTGGAIFMNAGAYGGEMKDIVDNVTLAKRDGSGLVTVKGSDMDFSYRHSILEETGDIVVAVAFSLSKGDKQDIQATMAELTQKRNEKQPVQYPSAGSFFKRPEGHFAGKLIQDAGLKGVTVGGAQVSQLHSGFVINVGGATASDIIDLMHLVQNTVYDRFGVMLEPEVRIIGD
ncbi:MAG: UDP-N-acetylmuramate dehydrogenase [Firmicutes bacterium]|nr:UDP-N-acetylmuramate dehydrogenase [Bacillota bacterium]